MAGLLDVFGAGGLDSLGLLGMSPEDVKRARDDAQAQAMFALAGRLFQGGNTGASIAEGLQMGQQAYKGALQGQLADKLQTAQIQDMVRKQQEAQAAKAREIQLQKLVASGYTPEQATYGHLTPQQIEQAGAGLIPVQKQVTAPASYDLAKVTPALMAVPGGIDKLAQISKAVPDLRKAGAFGQQNTGDNPFAIFVNDPTVPAPLRATAAQYQKSYSAGALDQETADKRFAELAQRIQSAQQFQQTQAGLEAQRQQSAAVQGILTQDRLDKIEQRKIEQAKPVTEAKESLALLNQAEKLLDSATGSLTGTAVDVVAGALGKSTPGAQATSKLKAIQGALVAKMPKMSGPQSDKDVLLYREMAGQVGDSTLPIETRKAAIETIREIQERYAKVEPGSSKPVEPTPTKFKFEPAKENRYQQWLKTQGNQ